MRISELDDIEKAVLTGTKPQPRPGEKIQKFWCPECREFHEGSVLGGPIGDPHGEAK